MTTVPTTAPTTAPTVLDEIAAAVAPYDLALRKAIPRGTGHLLLVLTRPDGSFLAGQWYAEPARARQVAGETRAAAAGQAAVTVLGDSGVLVQPDGADRRLPALHRLATSPGATLVSHRAERRGLVRDEDGDGRETYTKNVRPDRLAAIVARADVRVGDVAVPRVVATDTVAGTMTSTSLPGRTLQQLLDDPAVPQTRIVSLGREAGAAVARLHATPPPPATGRHDAAVELAVTWRWLTRARAHGLLDDTAPPYAEALAAARRLLAEPATGATFLHRDLHDMQVVVDDTGGVGLLDFDLASTGEPALDLANLLVHLELKALLGACPPDRAADCAAAVVDGYAPTRDVWRRVPAYALSTRLRLAAVNAFRPPRAHTGHALLTRPVPGPLRDLEELA